MSSRDKFSKKYLRYHKSYAKRAQNELLGTFRGWVKNIKWEELMFGSYKSQIANSFNINDLIMSYARIYVGIGTVHGKRVGKDIHAQIRAEQKKETKSFSVAEFLTLFEMNISQYLRTFGLQRITSVRKEFTIYITQLLEDRLDKGLGIEEVARQIEKEVNKRSFYRWQAMRIARTESTAASNYSAQEVAKISGFVMVKEWVSTHDARTRRFPEDKFDHVEMDGKKVDLTANFLVNEGLFNQEEMSFPGDPRGSSGNIINCYLPDSIISSNITEGQKSFYSGKVIEIINARGDSLTITPNHGIMTEQGFIRAKDINIGDNLICNRVNVNPIFRLVNHYIKKKMFTAENIFSTLEKFWSSKQVMVTGLDFNTDGNSINGYINIVYPEVKLRNSFESFIVKCINYFNLKTTNTERVMIASNSTFNLFSSRSKASFRRLVSFLYLAFPSLFRHLRPFKRFSFGVASYMNTKRFKSSNKSNTSDTRFIRELLHRDSGLISFNKVVNIRNFNFSGHVYDFTSYNGVNIVNNIYTSNCRCAVSLTPKKKNGRLIRNK